MKAFAQLFSDLDQTHNAKDKVVLLKNYFAQVSDPDKVWCLALLTQLKPKRLLSSKLLKAWAMELTQIPEWLFQESYAMVGDLNETLALLLPPPNKTNDRSLSDWIDALIALQNKDEGQKKTFVMDSWQHLNSDERLAFNKLISGGFRTNLSQKLVVQALAEQTGIDRAILAQRLTSNWHPSDITFNELFLAKDVHDSDAEPYPFLQPQPLVLSPETLGISDDWQAEWFWDGMRVQLLIRNKEIYIWSDTDELVTDKFPELHMLKNSLPEGTVLDGEVMAFKEDKPLPLSVLQSRMGRKNLTKSLLRNAPVHFMAFDILEHSSQDCRAMPLIERRYLLEKLISPEIPGVMLSPKSDTTNWSSMDALRGNARSKFARGLVLKNKNSAYQQQGDTAAWYTWKTNPMTITGVLMYAQRALGSGTDKYAQYTFGLWQEDQLVSFAKVKSALTDDETHLIDEFVKENTLERFGPVRTVKAQLVFELAFEDIRESARHKSGIVLRNPHILHWHKDKKPEEANTLEELKDLLKLYG